jgi:hypothetical protein
LHRGRHKVVPSIVSAVAHTRTGASVRIADRLPRSLGRLTLQSRSLHWQPSVLGGPRQLKCNGVSLVQYARNDPTKGEESLPVGPFPWRGAAAPEL